MSFVKLDTGLLESSLWSHRDQRDLFLVALLKATPREIIEDAPQLRVRNLEPTGFVVPPGWYGFLPTSGGGLIRAALIPEQDGMLALEKLGEPDLDSKSQAYDGRRLVRVDGGYIVLNYMRFRDKDHTAAKRQQRLRERQREKLKLIKSPDLNRSAVTDTQERDAGVTERDGLPPFLACAKQVSANAKQVPASAGCHDKRPSKAKLEALATEVYEEFPRKVARQAAMKAIVKSIGVVAPRDFDGDVGAAKQWLKAKVVQFASSPQGQRPDKNFIPHPATWFNDGRFDDDPAEWNHVGANGKSKSGNQFMSADPAEGFDAAILNGPAWPEGNQ